MCSEGGGAICMAWFCRKGFGSRTSRTILLIRGKGPIFHIEAVTTENFVQHTCENQPNPFSSS